MFHQFLQINTGILRHTSLWPLPSTPIPTHHPRLITKFDYMTPKLFTAQFRKWCALFQFNMGKKFGGYSWLRSADSRRRRLEYFLGNKWERDGDSLGQVSQVTRSHSATDTRILGYNSQRTSAGRYRLHTIH